MADWTLWLQAITSQITKDIIPVQRYLFGLTFAALYFVHKVYANMRLKSPDGQGKVAIFPFNYVIG